MPVEAELARKNAVGTTVPWVLVDDAENLETGLADPAVDFGARSRLDEVITRLESLVSRLDSPLSVIQGLVPTEYDHISLTYTGENVTGVQYRQGGAAGTIVATLTLTYSGSNVVSVTRT